MQGHLLVNDPILSRRLAAILVADVVGSSRLVETDETYALTAIHEVIHELLLPTATKHGGRLVKTMGDGALIEFSSSVAAVTCADVVQKAAAERANAEPEDRRVLLRIGINLGDVVAALDGDLYGEGVNIAARLEPLAVPGGIAISGKVYDELHGKFAAPWQDQGNVALKNVTRPVKVWALLGQELGRIDPSKLGRPATRENPSIAVLPFTNMSGDPAQEYFADGIVEDVITALSRIRWFFVIARTSTFTYKGKPVDIRQVGRELGVRFVLEGSVRKSDARIRITCQLIEAATGQHIWANRFDGAVADIFDLQDQVTEGVVSAIEPTIRLAEINRNRARPTEEVGAYDLYLRALPELTSFTATGLVNAGDILQRAVQIDPNYAEAWAAIAECLTRRSSGGLAGDVGEARAQALSAARKAVEADPQNGAVLSTVAWVFALMAGPFGEAREYANQALRLQPSSAQVRLNCGWVFAYDADTDRAVLQFETALRMNPLDPRRYAILTGWSVALFFGKRFEEAARMASRAVELNNTFSPALRWLAASLAHLGRYEEARETVARVLEAQPASSIAISSTSTFAHPWMMDLYLDGLRKAGLPE